MIMTSIIFAKILLENEKIKLNTKNIILIIIAIVLYAIVAGILNGILKTLIICLIYTIIYRNLFKINYAKAILLAFENIILLIIPDLFILLFSVFILNIDSGIFYNIFTQTIVSTLLVNIMLIILAYILRKPLRKISNIKIDNNKAIIIYLIISLFSILVVFYTEYSNVNTSTTKELILGIIVIISFVLILFSLIKQKLENMKLVVKYDKLLEFIKTYEKELDEQKTLRHESKNQLITVRDKIIHKDKEVPVMEYLNNIIAEHVKGENEKYTSFQYLPANGIKGLFYYKAREAEDYGIKTSINVSPKVENSHLFKLDTNDSKDLCRIIGVYLDNAIEASKESDKKMLGIEIYKRNSDIEMIISNTYNGVIDIDNIGKRKYTTKGKNHGYGLILVNKIIEKNKRYETKKVITEELYEQRIIIKKPISK